MTEPLAPSPEMIMVIGTLRAGDTLVVHASWKDLHRLERNRDLVIATDVAYEALRPFLAVSLGMLLVF